MWFRIAFSWVILCGGAAADPAVRNAHQGVATDARWSLLRSIPNLGSGDTTDITCSRAVNGKPMLCTCIRVGK